MSAMYTCYGIAIEYNCYIIGSILHDIELGNRQNIILSRSICSDARAHTHTHAQTTTMHAFWHAHYDAKLTHSHTIIPSLVYFFTHPITINAHAHFVQIEALRHTHSEQTAFDMYLSWYFVQSLHFVTSLKWPACHDWDNVWQILDGLDG